MANKNTSEQTKMKLSNALTVSVRGIIIIDNG